MKNSIIVTIVIIAMFGSIAQAASQQQIATYKWQSAIEDTTQRNAFRRMAMVKIVNDIPAGIKANIRGDSVEDFAAYTYRGVMDANDMGIIKNIIDPSFDNNPTPAGTKDANGNSVW